jgi:hypothetical protein
MICEYFGFAKYFNNSAITHIYIRMMMINVLCISTYSIYPCIYLCVCLCVRVRILPLSTQRNNFVCYIQPVTFFLLPSFKHFLSTHTHLNFNTPPPPSSSTIYINPGLYSSFVCKYLNYYEKENKNSNNFHVLLIRNEHFWVPIADFWRESDEK